MTISEEREDDDVMVWTIIQGSSYSGETASRRKILRPPPLAADILMAAHAEMIEAIEEDLRGEKPEILRLLDEKVCRLAQALGSRARAVFVRMQRHQVEREDFLSFSCFFFLLVCLVCGALCTVPQSLLLDFFKSRANNSFLMDASGASFSTFTHPHPTAHTLTSSL